MKGMKCRCGFATTSQRNKCPKCGRLMTPAEWADVGKVLSFTRLQAVPEGMSDPYDLVLVGIDRKGPKVVCWAKDKLDENEGVLVTESGGKYLCVPKSRSSKPDR
jgi:uncharacterized OB-fold protein